MRLKSLFIVGLIFSSAISQANIPRTEGGGYMIATQRYPAVVRITMSEGHCSATLIGPNVILTAQHCTNEKHPTGSFIVGNTQYNFKFLTYKTALNDDDVDLAIGIVDKDVEGVSPMSINFTPDHGKKMFALGFGCSHYMLSQNFVKIESENEYTQALTSNDVRENVFGCPGDSGGPTLAYNYDLKLQLVGIHYASNMQSEHTDWKTSNKQFADFIAAVAKTNNLKICDYNLECN
jgi:V8-like Glu-specific endopeptidase